MLAAALYLRSLKVKQVCPGEFPRETLSSSLSAIMDFFELEVWSKQ